MAETIPELIVLRHGETEWNVAGRWQGDLDSPLTPRGRAQARALGAMFARMSVGHGSHRILTSPQGRAVATARLVFGPGAAETPALREIGMGRWAGRTRTETLAEVSLSAATDRMSIYAATPGGEGFATFEARCRAFLAGLSGPTAVVTHGMTGRMLRVLAQGLPIAALQDLPGGQGVAYRILAGRETRLDPGRDAKAR